MVFFHLRLVRYKLAVAIYKVQFWGGKKTDVFSEFWVYLSQFSKSQLRVIKSELRHINSLFGEKKKSQLRDINSEFRLFLSELRESQMWYKKSQLPFFFQWRKQASILRCFIFKFFSVLWFNTLQYCEALNYTTIESSPCVIIISSIITISMNCEKRVHTLYDTHIHTS